MKKSFCPEPTQFPSSSFVKNTEVPLSLELSGNILTVLNDFPYPIVLLQRDATVWYLNQAFQAAFGWTANVLVGQTWRACIPKELQTETHSLLVRLWQDGKVSNVMTKCLTHDGQSRDVILNSVLLSPDLDLLPKILLTVRDVTREQRLARNHQALLRISEKLHQGQGLDELLEYVTREIQLLLDVGGAMILLVDDEQQEFFFRVAALDDTESGQRMKEVRFPVSQGVAGHVLRTGQPLIVPDTSQNAYFLKQVDEESGYETRNMLDVPLALQDRRIGVLCTVNKKHGAFDQEDVELLQTIAGTLALPLENARIHEQLSRSYEDVQYLSRAKDRVIHHLAHELKTPLSVISASLQVLHKRLADSEEQGYQRILDRAQRNVQRILDIQYEVEDILREKQYTTYHLLSMLLDACVDELDVLIADGLGEWTVMQQVRRRVEELFGPRESISRKIELGPFVERQLDRLRSRFAHRDCEVRLSVESTSPIWIPPDVLAKVVEGLIRNAVENTPDGSRIRIYVKEEEEGAQLLVQDHGIGITAENQHVIRENYFPAYEVMGYASRKPYDFNAGGKGLDLLRMRIFAERYHFHLSMTSQRCIYIPQEDDVCPGKVAACSHCHSQQDCLASGGTTSWVQFSRAEDPQNL